MFFKYKKLIKEKMSLTNILFALDNTNKKSFNKSLLKYIILFSSINFVYRFPQLILYFILKYYKFKYSLDLSSSSSVNNTDFDPNKWHNWSQFGYFCHFKKNCQNLFQISEQFFKISFISNFFILFFTNKTFRKKMKIFLMNFKINFKSF